MAIFGSYNNTASPKMKWYAEYSYSRISNSEISVTLTVNGEIINHSYNSYMGTGNHIVVTGTVAGQSETYEIKAASATWRGNSNNPRSCTFNFTVSSTAAEQSIDVSYAVAGSGYTAPANVPTQSTRFSSPALLYTASTVSASASYNVVSVTINRQSSDMTHTITYSRGSNSTSHNDCTTADTFTVPANWVADNATGYINISCATYIGSTYIGSTSGGVWITVPESVVPTITGTGYTIVDSKFGKVLQGVSKIKWAAEISGADGSWITESYISGGGYTVALNGQTGALYNSGDNTFTIYGKDSRGRTCTATVTIAVTSYTRPSVMVQSTQHCLEDGSVSDEGGYLSCLGTATYDNIDGQNTVTYQLWYREVGETAWSAAVAWTPGTATVIGDGTLSADTSYEVWYQAQDQVATAYYIDTVLHKRRIIDAYEDGTGVQSIGIGGAAKEDGKTTVYNPLRCLEPAQLAGGQWVHSAYGDRGTDAQYVKIAELTPHYAYADMALTIRLIQRGQTMPTALHIRFTGENTTDPGLSEFSAVGAYTNYWLGKESAGTWGLYAQKIGAYDEIGVLELEYPPYVQTRVGVAWTDEVVSSVDGATKCSAATLDLRLTNTFGQGSGEHGYVVLNGYGICWGYIQLTVSINSAWGSMYYGRTETQITYPLSFASSPSLSLTCEQISGNVTSVTAASSSVSGVSGLYFYAPDARTTDVWLHWCARGKLSGW
jgi:phage structural protein